MGRRLFWLIVGIVGFLIGLFVTVNYLQYNLWIDLLIGLVVGVIFASLAGLIPRVMTAVLGFWAFGIAIVTLGSQFGLKQGSVLYWMLFVIFGSLGASLAFWLLDWALIFATSLIGSSSILTGLGDLTGISVGVALWTACFLVLFLIGVSAQFRDLRKAYKSPI